MGRGTRASIDDPTAWGDIAAGLRTRLGADPTVERWLGMLTFLGVEDGELHVGVPNRFALDWFSRRYLGDLEQVAVTRLGPETRVRLRIDADATAAAPRPARALDVVRPGSSPVEAPAVVARIASVVETPASPRALRLDNFVVGESNRQAYRAIQKVFESVEQCFNPLFLFGPTGMGKTHLLRGIFDHARESRSGLKARYFEGERFLNAFVTSLKDGTIGRFRDKIRSLDLLILDDFHHLLNKKKTQEEFLHTFDCLVNSGAQVVVASTKHPRALGEVGDALLSRLVSGLVVTVGKPDCRTRLDILRAHTPPEELPIADEILEFVASRVCGNVRELIGALNQVRAHVDLGGLSATRLDATAVAAIVDEVYRDERPSLDPQRIGASVSKYFGMSVEDLRGPRRDRSIARARHVAIYLSRSYTHLSLSEIGSRFSRNASTVRASVQKVERWLETGDPVRRDVEALREIITAEQ